MTTTEQWIAAGAVIVAGFLIGAVLGLLARRLLSSQRIPDEMRRIARPTGMFLFWFSVAVGVVVAVGIINPGSLDSIPTQILAFLPRILAAGLILLGGYALAVGLGALASRSLGAATGSSGHRVGTVVRFAVMAAAVVFALAQLGVDVTILTILVGALAFMLAAASALLIGLGGRDVAAGIAAGRYVRRHVTVGTWIETPLASGTVSGLHEATMELTTESGDRAHVPYTVVLESGMILVDSPDS